MALPVEPQTWTRDNFVISTNKALLSLSAINQAFDRDFLYWTKAFSEDILQRIIDNSFCFGLYEVKQPGDNESEEPHFEQIGFARLVTDSITFAYLTDLYVLPEYQGYGLGGWMIDCVDEATSPLPHLRWIMLRTSAQKSQESYLKRMDMEILHSPDVSQGPITMGKRGKGNLV